MAGYETPEEMMEAIRDVRTQLYVNPSDRIVFMGKLVANGFVKGFEAQFYRKDGYILWIAINAIAVFNPEGKIRFFEGTIEDITERRRAEEALREANRKLNVLSTITRHDILNQLLASKATLNYLRILCTRRAKFSEFISKEIKAAESIEELIGFTRYYQDIGINAPTWLNVNESIHRAVAALPMREIRVEVDCIDYEVLADPLLEKVFYNLIDNALRHGGKKITTIRFLSHEFDRGMIIVCENDGVSISQKEKKHLFERGFGKHTGLGLNLVREILSITGITISETGKYGKGVRFEILVPKGKYRFAGQ